MRTFRTRYGQYKLLVILFRLCNGPALLQHYINSILFESLDQFCIAYLDNILVYSTTLLEHQHHIRQVLQKQAFRLTLPSFSSMLNK
jgi:hypothetical protein